MKIESPKFTYDIEFEQNEKIVFTQCADILSTLVEEMDDMKCLYVGCGDEGYTDYVHKDDIKTIIRMLWYLPQGFKVCKKMDE